MFCICYWAIFFTSADGPAYNEALFSFTNIKMLKFRGGGALLNKLNILLWCLAMRSNESLADCIYLNNVFFHNLFKLGHLPPNLYIKGTFILVGM